MRSLRIDWDRSFAILSLQAPDNAFESLTTRYSEPHRAYHTLQHIAECFEQFVLVDDCACSGEVGLALWFHDAIYDPRARDNEAKSAQLARAVLAQSGAIEATMDSIERLILATQHNAIPQGQDAEIVVYIDLSILGADESRYREYQLQIRREFGWVEEKAFRLGRSHVLQSFLDRPFIYSRPDFRSRLEGKARANLAREMADLA